MDARGPLEARLLGVERGLAVMDRDLHDLQRRLTGAQQRLWDAWSEFRGVGGATCTASFSGTLKDCNGNGWVGQTISVYDLTGSVLLGTITSGAAGAFSGSVTIMSPAQGVLFKTAGIPGYFDSTLAKSLYCGANSIGIFSPTPNPTLAPAIDPLSNLSYCGDPGAVTVNLTGITDGNSNTALPITIIATSTAIASIPNPTVTYTSPNPTGSITFTPVAGLCNRTSPVTITVKVNNSGSLNCGGVVAKVRTFTVTVLQPAAPTLDPIGNLGPIAAGSANQTVVLTGISPGGCNAPGSLSVMATSSNPGVSNVVSTSYTNPAATGSVVVSIGAAGNATISVTLTDGNAGRCGATNTKTRTFTVTVV
jgi:hypothetical protein